MENILITGASGLIGSMLVKLLSDYNLTCLVRDPKKASDERFIVADIRDRDALLKVTKGLRIDTIYHLAAINPLIKDKALQRSVNIDGMKNIVEIAKMLNVNNLIYAQGTGVFEDREMIDENTPRVASTEFIKTRLKAEEILLEASKDHGFKVCIPILGEVYGSKGWFIDIVVNRLKNETFRIPGSGEYYRSFIHVYDASNALKLLGEKDREGYYIVADDHPTKFKEFVYYTADKLGVKRPGKVPLFLVKLLLGSEMVDLFTRSVRASNTKLKSELNFTFRFPDYKRGIDDILSQLTI